MLTETFELPWLPDTPQELRMRLTLLLAPNYMGRTTDPAADAQKLASAVDAVIGTIK
jgi:hypothetical protein